MNASTMSKKRKLEYHPGRSSNHPSSLSVVTVLDQVTNQKNVKTLQKKKNDGVFGSDLHLPAPPPIEPMARPTALAGLAPIFRGLGASLESMGAGMADTFAREKCDRPPPAPACPRRRGPS